MSIGGELGYLDEGMLAAANAGASLILGFNATLALLGDEWLFSEFRRRSVAAVKVDHLMAQPAKLAQRQLADLLFPVRATRADEDDGILNVPLNERRLQTETYDFTISTIATLLREEKIVVPDFQRKYVWNRNQASRLIESLIIQCPIPVIYLDQENDGRLKVIDGNQRLMSIRLFLENGFKLISLKAFPDLNGFLFRQLDPRFRTHIENRTLRCITILKETHPQIKFDVFERLNTGAVQLNPQ